MHKIDTDTAVNSEFTDGVPESGQPATRLNASWFNTVQRELVKVVESAGITLSNDDDGQVYKSFLKIIIASVFQNQNQGAVWLRSDDGFESVLSSEGLDFKSPRGGVTVNVSSDGVEIKGRDGSTKVGYGSVKTACVDFGTHKIIVNSDGTISIVNPDGTEGVLKLSSVYASGPCQVQGPVFVGGKLTCDDFRLKSGTSCMMESSLNGITVRGLMIFKDYAEGYHGGIDATGQVIACGELRADVLLSRLIEARTYTDLFYPSVGVIDTYCSGLRNDGQQIFVRNGTGEDQTNDAWGLTVFAGDVLHFIRFKGTWRRVL